MLETLPSWHHAVYNTLGTGVQIFSDQQAVSFFGQGGSCEFTWLTICYFNSRLYWQRSELFVTVVKSFCNKHPSVRVYVHCMSSSVLKHSFTFSETHRWWTWETVLQHRRSCHRALENSIMLLGESSPNRTTVLLPSKAIRRSLKRVLRVGI